MSATVSAGLAATGLPVEAILQRLHALLAEHSNLALLAPPGAGKTSLVAPSLLHAPWLDGQRILLMLPRRLAARAAAERIAALLGEEVGRRVGYRTRLESKPGSRIECITEGLFVNRLIGDPGLEGVGALLFDECHERNLDGDLGLALALDTQQLRPELRIIAMSATLDGARFSRLMGNCPIIESQGRQFPVTLQHRGRSDARIEDRMAAAIHQALSATTGNILAFLPGVAEIERTAERLRLPDGVSLHRLHGGADPAAQRAALAAERQRKLVLATSIAETSLTIDGVTVVIDSGLARRPRYDRASGLTRLSTERVSQAAATQRAGRAGRQAPGIAIRLWDEGETRGLIPQDPPEILEADLAPLMLRLASWGASATDLRWLDPPPRPAQEAALGDLRMLGAMDKDGRLTQTGRAMARLPLAPRIAAMLLAGSRRGQSAQAADIAVLIEERSVGGQSADIDDRLRRFSADRGRAGLARRLSERWSVLAQRLVPATETAVWSSALLLAAAFPDRIARRRRAPGPSDRSVDYVMANGRGVMVDAADPIAAHEWLVVADAGGAGPSARVRLAAGVPPDDLAALLEERTETVERLAPDPESGRLALVRTIMIGAIAVSRTRVPASREAIAAALLAEFHEAGPDALPWPDAEQALRHRIAFAAANGVSGLPDISDDGLRALADQWLAPRLAGSQRLADIRLGGALDCLLDYAARTRLDRFAPARLETPAGTAHSIDYSQDSGPEAEVRVQALFGLSAHPMLADGRVPLTLVLTSPAGRPIARTRDLAAFWKAGWRDVQKDMKGRYPRHPWPDDPAAASPTVRTKAADARRRD